MSAQLPPLTPDLTTLLARFEARYCWDRDPAVATDPLRIIQRTMDFGDAADLHDLEQDAPRALLVEALTGAPAGALRPRSWTYWHYRLDLTPTDHEPPPVPVRRIPGNAPSLQDRRYDETIVCDRVDWSSSEHLGQPSLDRLAQALKAVLTRGNPDDFRAVAGALRSGMTLADGIARAEMLCAGLFFSAAETIRALSCPEDSGCAALSKADKTSLRSAIARHPADPSSESVVEFDGQ